MDATRFVGRQFFRLRAAGCLREGTRSKAIEVLRGCPWRHSSGHRSESPHRFSEKVLRHIEQGIAFYEAKNHFEAQGGKDAVVEASSHLKTIAARSVQNRKRHPLACRVVALRHWRNSASRHAARQLNHAGQSKSRDVGIDDDGVRTGDRT
jgi:hypothetical protein